MFIKVGQGLAPAVFNKQKYPSEEIQADLYCVL